MTWKYALLDNTTDFFLFFHRPIDLTMIKKNIENGTIRTTSEFQRDMMLMLCVTKGLNSIRDTPSPLRVLCAIRRAPGQRALFGVHVRAGNHAQCASADLSCFFCGEHAGDAGD